MQPLAETECVVTGAAGFLGTELVRALLRAGLPPHRLRCLVRDESAALARGLPAPSLRRGDLRDTQTLERLVDGADLVFHLAGTLKAARARDYYAINRDATDGLARLVAARAPKSFVVHVSSLAAAGPSIDGSGSTAPPAQCTPVSVYGDSKRAGEVAMLRHRPDAVVVRPPVVYGPGDAATRLLFRQALAPVCAVPPRTRPLSVVHAADVVAALLAAARIQPRGEVFALDGPQRTDTHALLRAISAAAGRRARLLPVPLWLAGLAALGCDAVAKITGRAGYFNGDKVRELRAVGWVADGTRARDRLGLGPGIDLEDGLREVAQREGFARAGKQVT